jgi:hypothetical protein
MVLRLPENVLLCSQYFPRNGFSFVFIPRNGAPSLIAPEGDQDDPLHGTLTDVERFGWVRLRDGDPYANVARVLGSLRARCGVPAGAAVGLDSNADVISPCLCFGEMLPPGRSTIDLVARVFETTRIVEVVPRLMQRTCGAGSGRQREALDEFFALAARHHSPLMVVARLLEQGPKGLHHATLRWIGSGFWMGVIRFGRQDRYRIARSASAPDAVGSRAGPWTVALERVRGTPRSTAKDVALRPVFASGEHCGSTARVRG